MAANSSHCCFLFLFFTLLTFCSSSQLSRASSSPSVYELLTKYGLPSGLLPDSVINYTLSEDGEFEVNLEKSCYIHFDYLVYYEKKITGKLGVGSITDLKGIKVQRFFFFWFDVDEIRVDLPPSGSIYFTVGIINKELDLDQFQTVRSCQDKACLTDFRQGQLLRESGLLRYMLIGTAPYSIGRYRDAYNRVVYSHCRSTSQGTDITITYNAAITSHLGEWNSAG